MQWRLISAMIHSSNRINWISVFLLGETLFISRRRETRERGRHHSVHPPTLAGIYRSPAGRHEDEATAPPFQPPIRPPSNYTVTIVLPQTSRHAGRLHGAVRPMNHVNYGLCHPLRNPSTQETQRRHNLCSRAPVKVCCLFFFSLLRRGRCCE